MAALTAREIVDLVRSVFPPLPGDKALAVLVDVPRAPAADNPAWRERRGLALEWLRALAAGRGDIPLEEVRLVAYADSGSNNADLPAEAYLLEGPAPDTAEALPGAGLAAPMEEILAGFQIFLAPTEYSATAPLKVAAKRLGFRAATMPGFSPAMIPALRVDYAEVARRVEALRTRLDEAAGAEILFLADKTRPCRMSFDLRFRRAHASTGRFPEKGTAGNLPSGEAYIVPYEGEMGEASLTSGDLPVQIGSEIVVFEVSGNRARGVQGEGLAGWEEAARLVAEPAYGNMAELGFGVLGGFGLKPVGEILLDEKLGLHVAFGRSEHFGGMVGPKAFSSPAAVVHLDRIYIPAVQPRISVRKVVFIDGRGREETIIEDGGYKIFGTS